MDELKKIITENRVLFDMSEPTLGHFDKFQALLAQQEKGKKSFAWSTLLKVASVSILIILSSLYIGEHVFNMGKSIAFNENKEYKEAKDYYVVQVNNQINHIENMQDLMSTEQKERLISEMTNMDNLAKKLQKDMNAMPNDPRIIEAMLRHYQMKMDILNRIITDLENVQQLNSENYESIEI